MDSAGLKVVPAKPKSQVKKPVTTVSESALIDRPFASRYRKKPKQDFITWLRNSTGFLVTVGLLITGFGIICFVPFHNLFSKLMLDVGLVVFLFALVVKLLDILVRIVTERR